MTRKKRHRRTSGHAAAATHHDRIFGVHASRAAITNPGREILTVYGTTNGLSRITDLLETESLNVIECSSAELTKRLGSEAVHQGILVEAAPLAAFALDEVVANCAIGRPLVVLDQVTDPHNVGAILRSAAAFNASGLVMTRRNSPPLDGVLAKAASGAVEHVPVVLVANLARTLDEVGATGVTRIGLDSEGPVSLETAAPDGPAALVLGAEHRGLRRLTAENCDMLCRLTTTGTLQSLNVSNAAAVALHVLATRSAQESPRVS